jgi:hypothetical protein
VVRAFFRIVRGTEPALDDFKSPRVLGKPLRYPELRREWAEGVSVYDDEDHACQIARRFKYRLGSYVIKLTVPESRAIEFRQTTNDPRHFTIYAGPEVVMALVDGKPSHIPGAPEG